MNCQWILYEKVLQNTHIRDENTKTQFSTDEHKRGIANMVILAKQKKFMLRFPVNCSTSTRLLAYQMPTKNERASILCRKQFPSSVLAERGQEFLHSVL